MLGSGQAQMLYGDGYIDVAMVLAILAHPLLVVQYAADDVHGSSIKPLAIITLLKLGPLARAAYYAEHPRLLVDCRRSKAYALHHVV